MESILRSRTLRAMLILLGCAALLAGCPSGGGSGGGTGIDDDDDTSDDDSSDDDSGGDDDSGDDDSGDDDSGDDDDDAQPETWGGVWVSEGYSSNNSAALGYYCSASAAFYDPDDWEGWGDPDDEEDDCRLYYSNGGSNYPDYLSAGRVTVTGTDVSPIHLDPVAYEFGYYYLPDVDLWEINDLFDPGDNIQAHIAGGSGIGPVDLAVTAPTMINVTQPSNFDNLSSLPTTSMTFKWSPGGADDVFLTISTYTGSVGVYIDCDAPDEQGQITVAGRLMNKLQRNPQSMSVSLTRSVTENSRGSRPVQIGATTYRQRSYIIVK